MIDEADCYDTDEIVCPWCGHEHSDSWEIQRSQDCECDECGKPFFVEVEYSVTYTTSKNEEGDVEYASV